MENSYSDEKTRFNNLSKFLQKFKKFAKIIYEKNLNLIYFSKIGPYLSEFR
jgi:hypothetical protein